MWLSFGLCLIALIGQGAANVGLWSEPIKSKLRCDGQDNGCCTFKNPCGVGEGDCDSNWECKRGLICGDSNCPWGDADDCCYDPEHKPKPKAVVQRKKVKHAKCPSWMSPYYAYGWYILEKMVLPKCEEYNMDYFGHDLKDGTGTHLKVDSWMECSQVCRSNHKCQFWSYLPKWKVCYLKDANEKKTNKMGSISGARSCGPKSGCPEYRTDYFGKDLKSELLVPDWEKCADICKKNDKCQFWSYLKKWKVCYLKTANGGKRTKAGSVSGSKDCGPPNDDLDDSLEKRSFLQDCIKKMCPHGNWGDCSRKCEIYLMWK